MASSGLKLDHLTRIQTRRIQGVREVLSEKFEGRPKPRVTSNKRILKSVSDYIEFVANKWLVKRNGPSVFHITGVNVFFFFFCFFCLFLLSDAFLLLPLLLYFYFIFINYEYCFNCRQVVLLVLNIYNVILKCFQRFSRMIYMSHLKLDCMWLLFRLHLMYLSILTMRIMYILCPICEPGHSKTYAITFASIEDLDQPEHPAVWTRSSQCALLNFIFHTLYLSHACEEFARISYMFASVIYMYGKFWDFEVRFFLQFMSNFRGISSKVKNSHSCYI